MASVDRIVESMEGGGDIRFADLKKVCDHYFGASRHVGSHVIYQMPWQGEPFVNIQNYKGKSKRYQIRQVLACIAKLKEMKP